MKRMSKAEAMRMAKKNVVLECSSGMFRMIYNGFAHPWIESKGTKHAAWVLATSRMHHICWRLGVDVPSFVMKSRWDTCLYDLVDRLWERLPAESRGSETEVEK